MFKWAWAQLGCPFEEDAEDDDEETDAPDAWTDYCDDPSREDFRDEA